MSEPRYNRLERYAGLAATLPRWREAACAVVGLGGLGGGLVQHLARMGVRRLVLIDRDVVAEENLGHQGLFTAEHARNALPKAVAAAQAAGAINPDVETVPHVAEITRRNIRELLAGTELIFDGLDNYYARLLLNDYSRAEGVPYFYAGVVRGELSARAVIPGTTGCLRCLIDAPPGAGEVPTCASEGVFPPLLQVANALQLDAANRWLDGGAAGEDDALYSLKLPGWDLHRMQLHGPRADCPACHGRYEYLDGSRDLGAAGACGPDRAEVQLASSIELDASSRMLTRAGWEVRGNPYCLTALRGGLRYTLFAGGKVVQEGSSDPQELSRFVATHLGI